VKIKEQKMTTLQVQQGDVIRAYDFKPMTGRDDCYIEGQVLETNNTENGYQAYKILVTKDHFGNDQVSTVAGPDCRVGIEMFVPWRVSFMEYQGRIINLSR
jgi:hypothetical protein